jgi:hypothetical protein
MSIGNFQTQPSAQVSYVIALLLALFFLSACAPSSSKDEELHREIQALKDRVIALQEKLNQLQAGQQAIIDLLKQPALPPEPMASPPPELKPLSVAELLASKDRYLGSRVTVKGPVGPVMMHHKSLMLKSPQGMVEVLFGDLSDPKLIQILSSTPMADKSLTVTGVVNVPQARNAGAQLQINAEAIEF